MRRIAGINKINAAINSTTGKSHDNRYAHLLIKGDDFKVNRKTLCSNNLLMAVYVKSKIKIAEMTSVAPLYFKYFIVKILYS